MSHHHTKLFRTHAIIKVVTHRPGYDQSDAASYLAGVIGQGLEAEDTLEDITAYERDIRLQRPTDEINNEIRALTAQTAIDTFIEETGIGEDDPTSQLSDLLASLRHLADSKGINWEEAAERAERAYLHEAAQEQQSGEQREMGKA